MKIHIFKVHGKLSDINSLHKIIVEQYLMQANIQLNIRLININSDQIEIFWSERWIYIYLL